MGSAAVRSRVGRRGTLVIPAVFRHELGLEDGTPVTAELRDGGLFIRLALVDELTDQQREELLLGAQKAYAALRADPQAWAEATAEHEAWEQIAGETLPPEK